MNTTVKLSIIIPAYKVEEYIEQCLRSITQQLRENFPVEIIVVNDGSPDNSAAIAEKISKEYPDVIKIVNQENQGLSMARNNGLKVANGEYVWLVDSDDYLLPNALQDVFCAICEHPEVEVFSSFLRLYYETENTFKNTPNPWHSIGTGKQYLLENMPIGASQRFIFKRQFLIEKNLQFVPKILHEDAVFGYEMLYQVEKICVLDKPVYAYRIRTSGSIMSSIKIKTAYDLIFGHKYLMAFAERKVKTEDKEIFRESIFGLFLTLLDFCKDLYGTEGYKEFIKTNGNGTYISNEAKAVFKINRTNLKALSIAINPTLFINALKIRRRINKLIK